MVITFGKPEITTDGIPKKAMMLYIYRFKKSTVSGVQATCIRQIHSGTLIKLQRTCYAPRQSQSIY